MSRMVSACAMALALGYATVVANAQPLRPTGLSAGDKPIVLVQSKSNSCAGQCSTRCALKGPKMRGRCEDNCLSKCKK